MSTGPYEALRRRAAERIGELDLDPLEDGETIRAEVDHLVSAYQRRAFGRRRRPSPSVILSRSARGWSIPWSATDR